MGGTPGQRPPSLPPVQWADRQARHVGHRRGQRSHAQSLPTGRESPGPPSPTRSLSRSRPAAFLRRPITAGFTARFGNSAIASVHKSSSAVGTRSRTWVDWESCPSATRTAPVSRQRVHLRFAAQNARSNRQRQLHHFMLHCAQKAVALLGKTLNQIGNLPHPHFVAGRLRRGPCLAFGLTALQLAPLAARLEGASRLLGQPAVELGAQPTLRRVVSRLGRPRGFRGLLLRPSHSSREYPAHRDWPDTRRVRCVRAHCFRLSMPFAARIPSPAPRFDSCLSSRRLLFRPAFRRRSPA
jgi:hypothetical protein